MGHPNGRWPCAPRDLRSEVSLLRCFGKWEAEHAAGILLKMLQAANDWSPFDFTEFEQRCSGDGFALSGFGYLLEAGRVQEAGERYAATIRFAADILRHQRR